MSSEFGDLILVWPVSVDVLLQFAIFLKSRRLETGKIKSYFLAIIFHSKSMCFQNLFPISIYISCLRVGLESNLGITIEGL